MLSFLLSIIMHLVYFISILGWAYLKSHFFETDFLDEYENVNVLQNEVVFGYVGSPFSIMLSIIGTATIVALIYVLTKKHNKESDIS